MGSDMHEEHIVMVPFMAQGHLIPFLALATKIQQRTNFTITIATTPLNIKRLQNHHNSSSSTTTKINLAELPFCSSDHGLPPDTENTESLPLNLISNFCHASTSLRAPFRDLVSKIAEADGGRPPLCVISDVFFGWADEVAESLGTVNFTFSTGGAYGTAAYVSIWQNLPHRNTDSEEFLLPGFPDTYRFHKSQLHQYLLAADGTDLWSGFFRRQISLSLKSHGWFCNTIEEIEPLGLEVLRSYTKLAIWAIGPLLPAAMLEDSPSPDVIGRKRAGKEPGVSPEKCIEWLDSHPPRSVIYISFGSQNTINPSQMMEMAKGLEQSEKPFIWSIRPPLGCDINGEFRAEWLPEGFEERIKSRKLGLLVHKWAPQLEILSHKSTAAFLSHCGWNSVLESLSQGVPIIGWPLAAEQAYNSKMLVEEMGVALELTRGSQGALTAEEVKRVVELVMEEGGKGGDMKQAAVKIGEQIRAAVKKDGDGKKGSSLGAMDNFVAYALSMRRKN